MGIDAGFLGSYLGAAGQGFDYQNALDQRKQMYEDQRKRQAAADARTQTTFDEGQEAYQHSLTRRPVVEGQQDTRADAENTGLGLRNAVEQNTVSRIPTTNAHQDEAFDTEQALRKSQIANSGQEAQLRGLQIKMQQLGLDDASLEHASRVASTSIANGLAAYKQSGDPASLMTAYNESAGHIHGHTITGLTQNKDGSFTATQDTGDPIEFKDFNDLAQQALTVAHPGVILESMAAQQKAIADAADARSKDPKKFSELVRGEDGSLGNYDLGTNKFTPLQDDKGNPLRGTLAGKARNGVANDAAEAFYNEQIKNGQSSTAALAATQKYMAAFHPGVKGAWQGAAAPQQQQGAVASAVAGNQVAAPGAAAGAAGAQQPPKGFRQAADGNWYTQDPQRPGKFLMWQPGG